MRRYEIVRVMTALITVIGLPFVSGVTSAAEPVVLENVADSMVQSCWTFAQQNGLPPLSIAVVDTAGSLVMFKRQPGASALSGEVAVLKASSSARTGFPTAALATQDTAARDLFVLLKVTNIAGGVPVKNDSMLIGAIGVSGGLPTSDADCALHAAEVVTK